MLSRRQRVSLVAVLVAAVVAPGPAIATPADPATPLLQAIGFVPPSATLVRFTDWAGMKATHAASDITSAAPIDGRLALLAELAVQEAPFADVGGGHAATLATTWGWDTTDLDWEAEVTAGAAPVSVLRFRDGVDLAPVRAWYDARGFRIEQRDGATIRCCAGDPAAAWRDDGPSRLAATAFLDDGRTLVVSEDRAALDAVVDAAAAVDAGDSLDPGPAAVVAQALERPLTALLVPRADCAAWGPAGDPAWLEANAAALAGAGPLHPWEAFGVGMGRDGRGGPVARAAFGYAGEIDAAADLAGRTFLADQATSRQTGLPYALSVLDVTGSDVAGRALWLEVHPFDGDARRIRAAAEDRDLLFAACG